MSIQCATTCNHVTNSAEEKCKRDSFHIVQGYTSPINSEVIKNFEENPTAADIYRLSLIQSFLFATILKDAIAQLGILEASNNELRMCKALDDINLLRSLKYEIEQPTATGELDGIIPAKIFSDKYKLKKLDNDRKQFGDTLTATYFELCKNQNWTVLAEKIKLRTDAYEHRTNVTEEETRNRATRRELARQLRQLRNQMKSANYDTDVNIEHLRSTVGDSSLDVEVRSRYTENWERARFEQYTQAMADVEVPVSEAIEVYKQHIDQEQRVHVEIEMLTNICINETLRKVESWMNKYEKDIEAIDLKIQIRKNEYEVTLERREEFEKTLEIHEEEKKIWILFKEEREKVRSYNQNMHKSAVVVQAWWRGILVRFQMGPYKLVKKPIKSNKKK